MSGILAIWNDCLAARAVDYERWYQDEHLLERLSIPGFLVARRFTAIEAPRQFFTTYEVTHVDVLQSKAYLERLAHPSPRTASIMRDGFSNMCRTACARHEVRGAIRGSVALTIALTSSEKPHRLRPLIADLTEMSASHTHSEIWEAANVSSREASAEEVMRGGDRQISICLVLEYLRAEEALSELSHFRREAPDADIGVYRLLCTLDKGSL